MATAIRAIVRGDVQGVGFRDATVARAREMGVQGWVRHRDDGVVVLHAEGGAAALEQLTAFLEEGPPDARVAGVDIERVKVEGHEQFAIRGVSAGAFVVREDPFELWLEVDGVMRCWAVPKGPSLDPRDKRFAVQIADHDTDDNVTAWDRGTYEQGGRVPWPEAIERGHAVFVLHGEKLRGGFALQRTRSGEKPQWLLVKRRDDEARSS